MAERKITVLLTADDQGGVKVINELGSASETAERKSRGLAGGLLEVGKVAGGFLAAQAVIKGPELLSGMASSFADLELQAKKAATVFGDELGSVKEWAAENSAAMGLTKNEATNLAAGLADLLIPMGMSREEAAKMATETIGLSGALAEWSGGQKDAAEVAEILQKAYLGETDGLKALGISISAADVQARLLAKGQDDLTGAALEQARALAIQELVFEKSTDAQAAFANGADSAARKKAEMTAKVREAKEALATALGPAIIAVTNLLATVAVPAFSLLGKAIDAIAQVMPSIVEAVRGGAVRAFELAADAVKRFRGPLLEVVEAVRGGAVRAFEEFSRAVRRVDFGDVGDRLASLKDAMPANELAGAFEQLGGALGSLKGALEPILPVWGALAEAIGGELMQAFRDVGSALKEELGPALADLQLVFERLQPVIERLAPIVGGVLVGAITAALVIIERLIPIISIVLVGAIEALATIIEGLAGVFEGAFTAIEGLWNTFKGVFTGDWELAWQGIQQIFEGVFTILESIASAGLELVRGQFETAYRVLNELTGGKLDELVGFFSALGGRVVAAVGDFVALLLQKGRDLMQGLWNGITETWDGIGSVASWLRNLPLRILSAIGDVSRLLWDVGRAIINSLWDGMKSMWDQVTGWVSGLGGTIASLKGPIEVDRRLLEPEGAAIMEGLGAGLRRGFAEHARTALTAASAEIAAMFGRGEAGPVAAIPLTRRGPGAGASITVNNYGPVYATSGQEAERGLGAVGWGVARQLRARGVA